MLADRLGDLDGLWRDRAACTGLAISLFDAPRQGKPAIGGLRICQGCPVRAECLDAALAVPEGDDDLVWGGTTFRHRNMVRRGRWTRTEAMAAGDRTAARQIDAEAEPCLADLDAMEAELRQSGVRPGTRTGEGVDPAGHQQAPHVPGGGDRRGLSGVPGAAVSAEEGCGCAGGRCRIGADDPRHGTDNGYTNLGCRCQPCRQAHTAACRVARLERARTTACPYCDGPGSTNAWGLCDPCAAYRRRHGRPRPPAVYAPTPRVCFTCSAHMPARKPRRAGRCEPCARYLARNGIERPAALWTGGAP